MAKYGKASETRDLLDARMHGARYWREGPRRRGSSLARAGMIWLRPARILLTRTDVEASVAHAGDEHGLGGILVDGWLCPNQTAVIDVGCWHVSERDICRRLSVSTATRTLACVGTRQMSEQLRKAHAYRLGWCQVSQRLGLSTGNHCLSDLCWST